MNRWVLRIIVALCGFGLCIAVTSFLIERSVRRTVTNNGAFRDFHDITAKQLDQQVRSRVPLGSDSTFVEDFLKQDRMEFSFNPSSRMILANAPYTKGSNFLIYESLEFTFQFDGALRLTEINSKVKLTGP